MLTASLLKIVRNFKDFSIRVSQDQQMEKVIKLRGLDQARIGIYDYRAYKKYENCEFWSGVVQNNFAGIFGFIKHDENLAYIGSYYVLKQLRSQGYGLRIWDYVLNKLKAKNIALNTLFHQQAKYQKSGFKTQSKGVRYIFKGTNTKYESDLLVNCDEVDFQLLSKYDRQNFPVVRQQFLKTWISLPESKSIAFVRNNKIEGYGVLRKASTGYKIGPLFADNYEIASQILRKLTSVVSQDTQIMMDTPGLHEDVLMLAKQFNMKNETQYARMFTNGEPQIFKKKSIYGITSTQFG